MSLTAVLNVNLLHGSWPSGGSGRTRRRGECGERERHRGRGWQFPVTEMGGFYNMSINMSIYYINLYHVVRCYFRGFRQSLKDNTGTLCN